MTARVKETDSNERVYVTELGGRTPAELYEHYLRVKRDQYFVQNSCEFPFIFEMGGIPEELDGIVLNVSVQDSGIGIKREDIRKLFYEFERIDEKRNRNIEGTGLGMNITKQLLELMGTTLEVESVYGEGSKFSFRLKQRVVRWDPIGNYEEAYRIAQKAQKKYRERFTAPDATVLVVDDTPMNLLVFKSLLSRTRVRVHMADGGEEALALCREQSFDLIFLDHMMPVMDGIETLHALKGERDNPNAHTPVVCLTANAISGARERYLAEGFDDYLTKPIDSVKLEELLLHYLPAEIILQSGPEERQEDPKQEASIPELEALRGRSGLDIDAGIKNSGSAEAYLPLLQLFSASLDEKIEELDLLCREDDVRGYTIKIHAMKSSARMFGAMELGEEAQLLEQAGGDGDWALILERHEAYLQKLRALRDRLSEAFPAERPDADEEMMEDALEELRCAAEDRDGDRLMDVFAEMNDYRIPGSRTKLWEALSEASENGDYEEILKLLSEHA